MPISAALIPSDQDDEEGKNAESGTNNPQPPPVVPRRANVTVQSWQSISSSSENYGDNNRHARSGSMDSLESSGSSSSGGGSITSYQRCGDQNIGEYISTRLMTKTPKLPPHNPLQFVKVQSPLYIKAEQQIKLTKEVTFSRGTLKEGEEEWQSNLDNWKSRRRKVTEKVIQRAEEMQQIQAEEKLRHDQNLLQQRKIKKFSEIVEKRPSRSYNLDLYIGHGNDSGLGGTPEPDDVLDSQSSILRSDTSEGMTSEAESIDSDSHKSDKVLGKEAPVVPQKPKSWLKSTLIHNTCQKSSNILSDMTDKKFCSYDNASSSEPSDLEGHTCDNETISSEEDTSFGDSLKLESDLENPDEHIDLAQNEYLPESKSCEVSKNHKKTFPLEHNSENEAECVKEEFVPNPQTKVSGQTIPFKLCIKPGDNKGFGFTVKGGKDLDCIPYIESVLQDSSAYLVGLKEGDEIISLNGEPACTYSYASLLFTIKQAVYTGILDLQISRAMHNETKLEDQKLRPTNKKSSFAEKLALFSTGTNVHSDAIKTQPSNKANVSESLVLRRLSAFENGPPEKIITRRSSCLCEETSNFHQDVDKRFSVDLSSQSRTKKKDPPPPVPVKPKLKTKQIFNFEMNNAGECDNHLIQTTNHGANIITELPSDLSNKNSDEDLVPSNDVLENHESQMSVDCQAKNINNLSNAHETIEASDSEITHLMETQSEINAANVTVLNISNRTKKLVHQVTIDAKDTEINPISLNDYKMTKKETALQNFTESDENCDKLFKDDLTSSDETEKDCYKSYTTAFEISLQNVNSTEPENTTIDERKNLPEISNSFDNSIVETIQNHPNLHLSAYSETGIVKTDSHTTLANPDFSQQSQDVDFENIDASPENKVETAHFVEHDSSEAEKRANISLNSSPLCLPLEKTEDDDVISASTTTSSGTPDTETVIETLPTNLSPLPNDESNGEDSAKEQNCSGLTIDTLNYDTIKEAEISSHEYIDENLQISPEVQPECQQLCDNTLSDQPVYNPDIDDFGDTNDVFLDDQDEEYRQELDESLDQITSLDVIDEMENRLMQQLELQDKNFEDLDASLALQLENDINQEWIYYTESDLFDDLTPRNREPPSEPPPPPPVECEVSEEQVSPLKRANSTKRIKKELWRRRSDFLGLDISECVDVDLIPPPPGLEEILRLEREQDQMFEKRLSLVEAESILDSAYAPQSSCLDSQDLMQSDYISKYFLDDEEDSKLDLATESWKENLEENNFETYDSTSMSEIPLQVPDNNVKVKESPQHKAKQNIHDLGAAPKAKIMDSNKWITEKVAPVSKRTSEPVIRQSSYDQNYWIAQDAERKRSNQKDALNRRYSMTTTPNTYPNVTVRTWGDRENEFQKRRPNSELWKSPSNRRSSYDSEACPKQDLSHTHSYDDDGEEADTDVLESEVHKCSCCGKGLCEGSAMGIEALRLYFHIECFRCCLCQMPLGNGMCGTDVQVKNNQLYCSNCFTVD